MRTQRGLGVWGKTNVRIKYLSSCLRRGWEMKRNRKTERDLQEKECYKKWTPILCLLITDANTKMTSCWWLSQMIVCILAKSACIRFAGAHFCHDVSVFSDGWAWGRVCERRGRGQKQTSAKGAVTTCGDKFLFFFSRRLRLQALQSDPAFLPSSKLNKEREINRVLGDHEICMRAVNLKHAVMHSPQSWQVRA